MSASTSSPTIQVSFGSESSTSRAASKYAGLGFPSTVASCLGRVLESRDEGAGVQHRAARRLPPAVLVQAVELGAALELGEGAREVHVAEDLVVQFAALLRAAEQDRVGALADELDPLEVLDDVGHRQREDAFARKRWAAASGVVCSSVVVELDPEAADLAASAGASAWCCWSRTAAGARPRADARPPRRRRRSGGRRRERPRRRRGEWLP